VPGPPSGRILHSARGIRFGRREGVRSGRFPGPAAAPPPGGGDEGGADIARGVPGLQSAEGGKFRLRGMDLPILSADRPICGQQEPICGAAPARRQSRRELRPPDHPL